LTTYCRDELLHWRSLLGEGHSEYVFPGLSSPSMHLTSYRHAW
jgi:hypothetical protein